MAETTSTGIQSGSAATPGPELSAYEVTLIERLFSSPMRIPRTFKAWLISYLETDPPDFITSPSGTIARGAVIDWVGLGDPPQGYVLADGRTLRIKSYLRLFDAIGTSFNTGHEPAGTFRLPKIAGGGKGIRKIIKI